MLTNTSARRRAYAFVVLTCGLLACGTTARAVTVTGLVLGPDGQPVREAQVYVQPFFATAAPTLLKTNANGRFVFDAAAPLGRSSVARSIVVAPRLAVGGGVLKPGGNTIHLAPAAQATGQVTDAQGVPVAGARVNLRFLRPSSNRDDELYFGLSASADLEAKFTATSDTNGRWTIPGVPAVGNADVVLDDPSYVHVRGQVPLAAGAPAAAPLVARPGATLTGRIIYEDGRPAVGVRIGAQGQASQAGWSQGVSGADGSYRLPSLATGTYNVLADEGQKFTDVVASALEGAAAREGQTTALPDLVLGPGALVEGTVTDAATGRPLTDLDIGTYGPHRPRSSAEISICRTDGQGRYQIRVAPGKSYIYLLTVPSGYLRPESHADGEDGVNVAVEKGQTKTIAIRLKPGLTVAGTAVDENGKPVSGIKIMLGQETVPAATDAIGKWRVIGLKPGEVEISTEDAWQVVTPEKVTLPVAGLIQVTLRKRKLSAVTARVLDGNNTPVAGATVHADILIPSGDPPGDGGYRVRTEETLTDAAGKIELSSLRPDDLVTLRITKPGYKYVSGGAAAYQTNAWKVSDTVLVPLTAGLTGMVKDADGKPVSGAQVFSPDGSATTLVSTAANGQFTLRNLPAGEVTVMAAQGGAFGQAKSTTDDALAALTLMPVSLPPGADLTRARAIIENVIRESKGRTYYARDYAPMTLAPYDPDAALALMKLLEAAEPDRQLAGVISTLIELDPARARQWAPRQLPHIQAPDQAIAVATTLGLASAAADPDLAKQLLAQCKSWSQQLVPLAKVTELYELFPHVELVALAGRLQDPETEKMLSQVLTVVLKTYTDKTKPTHDDALRLVAEIVARGATAPLDQVLAQLGPAGQSEALSRAIPEVARYDVPAALRLLDRLERIDVTAEASTRGGLASRDPVWSFGLAAKPVIAALAKTDPAAALALARRVKAPSHKAMALTLAGLAQPPALRSELLHEASTLALDRDDVAARSEIAALAYAVDPALGLTLFRELKQDLPAPTQDGRDRSYSPTFAFYYARVEPGVSRLMLESEYVRLQQAGAAPGWNYGGVILAMAAVNPDRALAMARAIPLSDANAHFDLQRKIAQYLAAPSDVRATMSFARWNASDTWTPGTETRW